MEGCLKDLLRYRALRKQYANFSTLTQSTQTDIGLINPTKTTPRPASKESQIDSLMDQCMLDPATEGQVELTRDQESEGGLGEATTLEELNEYVSPLLPVFLQSIDQDDLLEVEETPRDVKNNDVKLTKHSLIEPSSRNDDVLGTEETLRAVQNSDAEPTTFTLIGSSSRHDEDVPDDPGVPHEHTSSEDNDQNSVTSGVEDPMIGNTPEQLSTHEQEEHQIVRSPYSDDEASVALSADVKEGDELKSKRAFCIYCKTFQSQLPRHLLRAHGDENRVKAFAELPKRDPKRLVEVRKIRLEGYKEIKKSEPQRIGAKRDYLRCSECSLLYSKRNFYRHYRKCVGKRAPKNIGNIMANVHSLETNVELESSLRNMLSEPMVKLILPKISDDREKSITKTITEDKDIIEFGNSLCIRFGNDLEKQQNTIRHKLRTVALFKQYIARTNQDVKFVKDIFHPNRWDSFVETVRVFSKLGESSIEKKAPSNVRHLGLLLSNLARDIEATCLDEESGKNIKRWLKIYDRKYNSTIGWQGSKLVLQKKWKTKKFIPLAEDIVKLNNYLKTTINSCHDKLSSKFDYDAWCSLTKACMTLLLCFNRKRIGEVVNISLKDYLSKEKVRQGTDTWKALSESEKAVASRYFHLQVRGKFSRPVPLLVSTDMADSIELVVRYRKEAGVHNDNQYLFAKRGDENSHYNPYLAMKEFSQLCGAKRPEDLRSRGLRTHIATVSQALNLSDNDLKVLSGFLGHTTKTHLEHYRMPSDVEHTARLSKLLTSLDSGNIHNFRGKTIDEIEFDEEIVLEEVPEDNEDDPPLTFDEPGPSSGTHFSPMFGKEKGQITPKKQRNIKKSSTPSPAKSSPRRPMRRRWLHDEIAIMKKEFKDHLKEKTLPSFEECNSVKRRFMDILGGRKASHMKAWINNHNKKRKESDSE